MSFVSTLGRPFRPDPRTGRPSWVRRKVTRAQVRKNRTVIAVRAAARRSGRAAVSEVFDLAGLALIAVGVGMFLLPAGVIVGGLACLVYSASNGQRVTASRGVQR